MFKFISYLIFTHRLIVVSSSKQTRNGNRGLILHHKLQTFLETEYFIYFSVDGV